jgi:hypothetical protein
MGALARKACGSPEPWPGARDRGAEPPRAAYGQEFRALAAT